MQLMAELMSVAPTFFGFLVLILAGLSFIVLLKTLIRIVQIGPFTWIRSSLRIDDDFWLPFAVIIWVIIGAFFALVWNPGVLGWY